MRRDILGRAASERARPGGEPTPPRAAKINIDRSSGGHAVLVAAELAMSLHILATGAIIADPVSRSGAKGTFATGTLRAATDDGTILVSLIAFGDGAAQLLQHRQGDALAISGRATLRSWTGKDGETKSGLSLVVEQIASAAAARRADADRRREGRAA